MIKLPELNRHVVGLSAVSLVIAGLGFLANRDIGAGLAEGVSTRLPQFVQQQASDASSQLLSTLNQLPQNVYGSAADQASSSESGKMAMTNPDDSQDKQTSPASESKFWSDQEWQAAAKAVSELRSSRKAEVKNMNMNDLRWQPPEEIGKKGSTQSR